MAVFLTLLLAATARADEGPHGGYGPSTTAWSATDKCAACHRAHTAQNADLLVSSSITDLCQACHGPGGLGADTDVWNGRFVQGRAQTEGAYTSVNPNGAWLNGGGFLAAWNYKLGTIATATSRHAVAGLEGNGILSGVSETGAQPAFGGGTTGPAIYGVLQCTSCHDPHGSSNYRLLNDGSSMSGALTRWVTDAASFRPSAVYSDQVLPASAPGGKPHDYTAGTNVAYDRGISDFCAACHTNYLLTIRSTGWQGQVYDSGDGNGLVPRFRHIVSSKAIWDPASDTWDTSQGMVADNNLIPLNDPNHLRQVDGDNRAINGRRITCLTCHFAHGSAAQATDDAAGVAPTVGSALLFLDNRGICQNCHRKTD